MIFIEMAVGAGGFRDCPRRRAQGGFFTMTLNQLRYFATVAKSGHLTRSAQELMLAQPSLTQAIRKLEDELRFPLFIKKGRTLILTKEGSDFLPYAEELLKSQDQANEAAERIFRERNGLIRFMHTEPIPKYYIPDLIRHFLEREENRDVRIECDIAGTGKIIDAILNDEINFGFCSTPPVPDDRLLLYPILEQPIVLAAAKSDPLCALSRIEPRDLEKRPCISYASSSALRAQLDQICEKWNIHPDIRYRSSAVQINNLVARGLGWAFVVRTESLPMDKIAILPMQEMNLHRTTYLAMRADRLQSPTAERFRDFVLDQVQK